MSCLQNSMKQKQFIVCSFWHLFFRHFIFFYFSAQCIMLLTYNKSTGSRILRHCAKSFYGIIEYTFSSTIDYISNEPDSTKKLTFSILLCEAMLDLP